MTNTANVANVTTTPSESEEEGLNFQRIILSVLTLAGFSVCVVLTISFVVSALSLTKRGVLSSSASGGRARGCLRRKNSKRFSPVIRKRGRERDRLHLSSVVTAP